jgi:hypothetical protein
MSNYNNRTYSTSDIVRFAFDKKGVKNTLDLPENPQ